MSDNHPFTTYYLSTFILFASFANTSLFALYATFENYMLDALVFYIQDEIRVSVVEKLLGEIIIKGIVREPFQ